MSEVDPALVNDADELQKMLRNVTNYGLALLNSVTHQFSRKESALPAFCQCTSRFIRAGKYV